jgi:Rhodanese-like domain.
MAYDAAFYAYVKTVFPKPHRLGQNADHEDPIHTARTMGHSFPWPIIHGRKHRHSTRGAAPRRYLEAVQARLRAVLAVGRLGSESERGAATAPLLTPAQLLARLPEVRVIDIRESDSPASPYAVGHVPGAVWAPYTQWRGPSDNPGKLRPWPTTPPWCAAWD